MKHTQSFHLPFDGRAIRVMVPKYVMTEWAESDQVSIQAPSQAAVDGSSKRIFNVCITLATKIVTPIDLL